MNNLCDCAERRPGAAALEGHERIEALFEAWLCAQWWRGVRPRPSVEIERDHLEPHDIYIASLAVPGEIAPGANLRGRGIARSILGKLAELSERYQVCITLQASEDSESAHWLQQWYERLGFEYHKQGEGDWGPYMVRWPRKRA